MLPFTPYKPTFTSASSGNSDAQAAISAFMEQLAKPKYSIQPAPSEVSSTQSNPFGFSSSSSAQPVPFSFSSTQPNPFSSSVAPSPFSGSVGFKPFTEEIKAAIAGVQSEQPIAAVDYISGIRAISDQLQAIDRHYNGYGSKLTYFKSQLSYLLSPLSYFLDSFKYIEDETIRREFGVYRNATRLYQRVFGHFKRKLEFLDRELVDEVKNSAVVEVSLSTGHGIPETFKDLRLLTESISEKIEKPDSNSGFTQYDTRYADKLGPPENIAVVVEAVCAALDEFSNGLDLIDRFHRQKWNQMDKDAEGAFGPKATMDKTNQVVLKRHVDALESLFQQQPTTSAEGREFRTFLEKLAAAITELAFKLEDREYATGVQALGAMCGHLLKLFGSTYLNPVEYNKVFSGINKEAKSASRDRFVRDFQVASEALKGAAPRQIKLKDYPGIHVVNQAIQFAFDVIGGKYSSADRRKKTKEQLRRQAMADELELKEPPSTSFSTTTGQGYIILLAFSPDPESGRLAVHCAEGRSRAIKIFLYNNNTDSWRLERTIEDTGWLRSMCFSPSGKVLVGMTSDQLLTWDIGNGEPSGALEKVEIKLEKMSVSSTRNLIAATGTPETGTEPSVIMVWSAESRGIVCAAKLSDRGYGAVRFSPDSEVLAAASHQGVIDVFSVHGGSETIRLQYSTGKRGIRINDIFFSRDGKKMIACYASPHVDVFDVPTGQLEKTIEMSVPIREYHTATAPSIYKSVLHEGRHLIRAAPGAICVLDLRTGKEVRKVQAAFDDGGPLALSPSGEALACHFGKGIAKLFDTESLLHRHSSGEAPTSNWNKGIDLDSLIPRD